MTLTWGHILKLTFQGQTIPTSFDAPDQEKHDGGKITFLFFLKLLLRKNLKHHHFDLDDLWSFNRWSHLSYDEKRFLGSSKAIWCFLQICSIYHGFRDINNWPVAGRKKVSFYFFKTIVFNALIPNILLSRLSDEQKCIFSHLKSADFETFCDWSTSSWRNNLDTPWCNNLVCNNLDDVITLWRDVKIVTPQGHVLLTTFGKLVFEYIFWYEVNQWFLNDIAQKFWKIMGFQNMINSHDVQLVNYLAIYVIFKNTWPSQMSNFLWLWWTLVTPILTLANNATNSFERTWDEITNASFLFSLRRLGAELVGWGFLKPPARNRDTWRLEPARNRVNPRPDGPLDFPPPGGGCLNTPPPPSISAPAHRRTKRRSESSGKIILKLLR